MMMMMKNPIYTELIHPAKIAHETDSEASCVCFMCKLALSVQIKIVE